MLGVCWLQHLKRFGHSSEAQHLWKVHQHPSIFHFSLACGDEVMDLKAWRSRSGIFNPLFALLQPDLNEEPAFWYRVCVEVTGCWWERVWWWSADHTGQREARNPKKAVRGAYFLFGTALNSTNQPCFTWVQTIFQLIPASTTKLHHNNDIIFGNYIYESG